VRRRLSLLVLAVTSMVVGAFVVPLGLLVSRQTESRALAQGERTAQAVASGLAVAASLSPDLTPELVDLVVATSGDEATSVFLPNGAVVGPPAEASPAVVQARTGRALSADAPGGVEILVPVSASGGTLVVRTWLPGGELQEGVAAAWAVLGALGVVLILAGVALADRMGVALVRPVTALAGAARRIAGGDLEARVEPAGPPEIADAGAAFNQLAGRLDDLIAAERESLADLSHRLRTPLTALRLQAESLPGGELLLEDIDRLGLQVDALISEARRRSPAAGPRRADLCAVASSRAAFWQVLAEEQGRPTRVDVPAGPIWVGLTEEELGAALDTLLENVFTHTPPGAAYAVAVTTAADGPQVLLVVEDEGPGFPHRGVAERGASEAGSSGLGLDIARRAARHTGGDLTLADRPGGGARVEVRFGTTPRA
jgi:signal transduction histidine kinase